jgi:hypothetical protein
MTSDLSQTAHPVAISFKDFRDEEIVDFFTNEKRIFHPETKPNGFGRHRLVGAPHFPVERKSTAAFRGSFCANGLEREKYPSHNNISHNNILQAEAVGTIPVPPDIFTFAGETGLQTAITKKRSTGNHSRNPKRKQIRTIEPLFEKSSRPLASVLFSERTGKKHAAKVVRNPSENSSKKSVFCSVNFPFKESEPLVKTPVKESELSTKTEPATKPLFENIRETDMQLDRLIETWPRLSSQLRETITTLLEVSEKDDISEK